jgi:hypothetical protein
MAETTEKVIEDVTVRVIGDRPVNGVYKDGALTMHPEIAQQFAELDLVEIVTDAAAKPSGKTANKAETVIQST